MLTEQQMVKRLYDKAEMFTHYLRRKEYIEAALTADWIGMIGVFIGLEDKVMAELLGDSQKDEPVEGIIKEQYRIKAMDWCVYHGYAQSYHTYQNIMRFT
jgi:hypothetical protein